MVRSGSVLYVPAGGRLDLGFIQVEPAAGPTHVLLKSDVEIVGLTRPDGINVVACAYSWSGWVNRALGSQQYLPSPKSCAARLFRDYDAAVTVLSVAAGGVVGHGPDPVMVPHGEVDADWQAVNEYNCELDVPFRVPNDCVMAPVGSDGGGAVLHLGPVRIESSLTVGLSGRLALPVSFEGPVGSRSRLVATVADEYAFDGGGPSGDEDFSDGY